MASPGLAGNKMVTPGNHSSWHEMVQLAGNLIMRQMSSADPHDTWMREPLSKDVFKRPPTFHHGKAPKWTESQVAKEPTPTTPLPSSLGKDQKPAASWARSGVRHEANTARVLTYDHGDMTPDRNLKTMADDLLSSICTETAGKIARRPLFFICHSIGGLVVKLALTQASRSSKYRPILEDCYGITFFATPHRGSSYLSIIDFGMCIQQLLHLSQPLTPKLRGELKLDHPPLLKIDDDFKQLSSEFRVWSFHETEDSSLSRIGFAGPTDIPFKAPVTSMRSAILGVRHEKVYALQSTHANCASFGMKNAQTLRLYLSDLGAAIQNAEQLNQSTPHVPLRLEQKVTIEVHGFYESGSIHESPGETSIRLFSTKDHSLEAFWDEGPDRLLEKRLNDIRSESQNDPQDTQFFGQKVWVKKVFDTISLEERQDYSELFSSEHWTSRHERGRHAQHHACFLRPACGPVPSEVAKETSLESRVIWEYLGHDPPFNCRRTLDQYRYPSLHDTRARDDDQMLYKMTKERVYLNGKPTVASLGPALRGEERTPTHYDRGDAAGFGDDDEDQEHLDSESESNEDEFDAKPEDDVLDGNVLMVDQLWLWAADSKTLVTFFPSREGNPMEGPLHQQADLRDSVFNEINDDLTRPCENALDLAALTVLHAVTALIERSSHPDLEIFRIFEEAISVLTEKMTSSLKRFRTTGFRNRNGEDDELKLNSSSIRARHKREDEKAEKENRDNTSALLELRDIEDELSTLNHLFGEQEEQINQMMAIYSGSSTFSSPPTSPPPPASAWGQPINSPPENNSTGTLPLYMSPLTTNGRFFLQEALSRLKSYRAQSKDMIERVKTTRQDFDKLLETVQRQAQIDEVRLSRQQADLASAQNRSVMIFTVFTVIFLPLSFFTSLFGMNTREWGGGNNTPLRTIGSIALPASALLVVSALFVAWSTSVRKAFKSLSKRVRRAKNRARRWWKRQLAALWKRNDDRPRTRLGMRKMRRKREAMEVKRQKNRMKREMTMHDFWERHQLDRETKYEIPSRNRKSISLARAKAKARKEEKERRG
ncbi:hypothetical protein INS49_015453 [Diaporthe citri]|uniref:uncharacterized protein n=1 Tax=Diaporthe citri TaxID=83186 RepID=UPI001C801753|nr:uncharacterized protein INS49_015453 [Diaporthe citri]KAG6356068.1 hypothetical protein INS49_015453 [Diaporthe citri]